MSSNRCKRCDAPVDFAPSEDIYVDTKITYYIWTEYLRCTLTVSPSPTVLRTFKRWFNKDVRWKFTISVVLQHLASKCCLARIFLIDSFICLPHDL